MTPRPFAPALAWLAAATALAACAHKEELRPVVDDRPTPTIADRHRIIVSAAETRLEVPLSGGAESFDAETRAALLGFARRYGAEGDGPIVVSTPAGDEAIGEAAGRRAEALLETLASLGVPQTMLAAANHAESSAEDARIILSFERYVARAPACKPLWEQNIAYAPTNLPWESFGCASQANLAAMISDPRDLQRPREETPADAFRRQSVLDRYREGKQTHAERSADERVGVSDAVK